MLGINCLLNTYPLKQNLALLVEYTGYQLAAGGAKPSFPNVWKALREAGIEVDIQTAGHLYIDAFSRTGNDLFTPVDQVEKAMGLTVARLARKTHRTLLTKPIGRDSPVVHVVNGLLQALAPDVGSHPTVQKIMQDALLRWARRKLEVPVQKHTGKTWQEELEQAFNLALGINPLDPSNPGLGILENSQKLIDELKTEFQEVLNAIAAHPSHSGPNAKPSPYITAMIQAAASELATMPHSLLLGTPQVRKIITGILSNAEAYTGHKLTRAVTRGGEVTQVIDWPAVIGLPSTRPIASVIWDVMNGMGYPRNQIDLVVDSIHQDVNAMLAAKKAKQIEAKNKAATERRRPETTTDYERLVYYHDLGMFTAAQQDALFKILGVPEVTAQDLAGLERILQFTGDAFKEPISQWSPTFRLQLQRAIENEIERIEERHRDGGMFLSIARVISFAIQSGSAVLVNIPNVLENVLTGVFHFAFTAFTNPGALKHAMSLGANTFVDIATGGTKVGTDISDTFERQGSFEARFNRQVRLGQSGIPGRNSAMSRFVHAVGSATAQLSRVFLTATDGAIKAAMVDIMTQNALYGVMRTRYKMSREEALVILNEARHANSSTIEMVVNEQIRVLALAGVKVNDYTKARMMSELSYANLVGGGRLFENMILDLKSQHKLDGMKDYNPVEAPLLRAIMHGAVRAAGRSLGHEGDSSVVRATVDKASLMVGDALKKARARRNIWGVGAAELGRGVWHGAFRFLYGGRRWWFIMLFRNPVIASMYLTASNTYFWGAYQFGDKLAGRRKGWSDYWAKNLKVTQVDADGKEVLVDQRSLNDEFTNYISTRERTVRMLSASILSTAMAYIFIDLMKRWLPDLLEGADDDDEILVEGVVYTPEELAELEHRRQINNMAMLMQRNPTIKRWFNKLAPYLAFHYLQARMVHNWQPDKGYQPFMEDNLLGDVEALGVDKSERANRLMGMISFDQWVNSSVQAFQLSQLGDIAVSAIKANEKGKTPAEVLAEKLPRAAGQTLGFGWPFVIWDLNKKALEAFDDPRVNPNAGGRVDSWQSADRKPDSKTEAFARGMFGDAGYEWFDRLANQSMSDAAELMTFEGQLTKAPVIAEIEQLAALYPRWEKQLLPPYLNASVVDFAVEGSTPSGEIKISNDETIVLSGPVNLPGEVMAGLPPGVRPGEPYEARLYIDPVARSLFYDLYASSIQYYFEQYPDEIVAQARYLLDNAEVPLAERPPVPTADGRDAIPMLTLTSLVNVLKEKVYKPAKQDALRAFLELEEGKYVVRVKPKPPLTVEEAQMIQQAMRDSIPTIELVPAQ